MKIGEQETAGCLDKDKILADLQQILAVKKGYLFDIIDLEFNADEFLFYYRLTTLFKQSEKLLKPEKAEEIALLSTLIYLSSKIHYAIAEQSGDHEVFSKQVQYPILVGDLLYGRFFDHLIRQQNSALLDAYMAYLIEFNGRVADHLQEKCAVEDVVHIRYGKLARLTIELLLSFANLEEIRRDQWLVLADQIGTWVGILQNTASTVEISELGKPWQFFDAVFLQSEVIDEFMEIIAAEARVKIKTFEDLEGFLIGR